jgi:hypothetical protein
MLIFRAYITTKSGRRIYAKTFGLKAFPIEVEEDKPQEQDS